MKRYCLFAALLCLAQTVSPNLLYDITEGKFRPKTLPAFHSMNDGEHYTVLADSATIVRYAYRTGQATDLKESAYTFFASSAEDDPQRFSLAFRLSETTETPWKVYLHDHVLYVLGLEGGERIYLYDMSGHCLLDTTGTAPQFATPVDGSGLYIVDIVSSKARRSFKVIAD